MKANERRSTTLRGRQTGAKPKVAPSNGLMETQLPPGAALPTPPPVAEDRPLGLRTQDARCSGLTICKKAPQGPCFSAFLTPDLESRQGHAVSVARLQGSLAKQESCTSSIHTQGGLCGGGSDPGRSEEVTIVTPPEMEGWV